MTKHLRPALWLLVFTMILCSVLYPLALWGIGRLPVFRDKAQGSLLTDKDGKIIGSKLIAQPFTGDEYFQPRPSAASYNAMASSGSNWEADNYKLRDRVARALGPMVRYGPGAEKFGKKPGAGVQDDIEAWFALDRYQKESGIVAQWASAHSGLADDWLKSTSETLKDQWKEEDKEAFFQNFSKKFPGEWPVVQDYETKDKKPAKQLMRVKKGAEIQAVFFDMWRQDHPDIPLEFVPADMVLASGSGLDPHITLDNARYQLMHRVAVAQADKMVAARAEPILKAKGPDLKDEERQEKLALVRKTIETRLGGDLREAILQEISKLFDDKNEAPLGGLVGVPLINVLEINVALQGKMVEFAQKVP